MARTLDPAAHAVRRDVFVDAAQRLIQTKGYERMSIQEVIDAAGASKGAFYHYFDSKSALLTAILDRLTDVGIARYGPAADDPTKSALEKFEAFIGGIADYKAEQRELILGALQTWLSGENSVVREHFRRIFVEKVEPLLRGIVRQGVDEGVFDVADPDATARVLVSLWQGLSEYASELFIGLGAGTVSFEHLEARFAAYAQAFERILGARPGSLKFTDPSVMRDWQRWYEEYRKDHS